MKLLNDIELSITNNENEKRNFLIARETSMTNEEKLDEKK